MSTPTPKETALFALRWWRTSVERRPTYWPFGQDVPDRLAQIDMAIAWLEGLQAEADAEKVRAFVAGATWAVEGTRVAEFEHPESVARRLLAEGRLGTNTGGAKA